MKKSLWLYNYFAKFVIKSGRIEKLLKSEFLVYIYFTYSEKIFKEINVNFYNYD